MGRAIGRVHWGSWDPGLGFGMGMTGEKSASRARLRAALGPGPRCIVEGGLVLPLGEGVCSESDVLSVGWRYMQEAFVQLNMGAPISNLVINVVFVVDVHAAVQRP